VIRAGRMLLLAAVILVGSPAAAKEAAWPTGLYSNVRLSEQTGDLGGMEARFYEEAGRHMVEFVWCEGWCNESFRVPVTRTEGGFAFSYFQRFADGDAEQGVTMRFLAWTEGKRLRISAWQGDEKLDYQGRPQLLKSARRPFGIDVANAEHE
jgi:hypothetical protein